MTISELVKDKYKTLGQMYLGNNMVPLIDDGFVNVARRLLLSVRNISNEPNGNFVKASQVLGHCIKEYHPVFDEDLYTTLCKLVDSKLLLHRGQFGQTTLRGNRLSPAPPVRLEVKLNPEFYATIISPPNIPDIGNTRWSYSGNTEEVSFSVPIPYALITGYSIISFGIKVDIPAFTAKSLWEAYKTNDYRKLECNYGYQLEYEGLEDVWDKGKGSFKIILPVEKKEINGISGYKISCNPRIFKPNLKKLEAWEQMGWLSIDDISDKESKLFIYRTRGVTQISDYDIYKILKEECEHIFLARCYAYDGETVRLIGIKEWLDYTLTKYNNCQDMIADFVSIWED